MFKCKCDYWLFDEKIRNIKIEMQKVKMEVESSRHPSLMATLENQFEAKRLAESREKLNEATDAINLLMDYLNVEIQEEKTERKVIKKRRK